LGTLDEEDKKHLSAEVSEATLEIKTALIQESGGADVKGDDAAVEKEWKTLLATSNEDIRAQLDESLERELLSVKSDLMTQVDGLDEGAEGASQQEVILRSVRLIV
jgi:hypothetical protein